MKPVGRNGSFPARALCGWYARHKRDLPWRGVRDPYRVWISEMMLQQTQVRTVIPYYRRFLRRFPDVLSLARARESTVLSLWSGLGYYSRARHLHRAARQVAREFGGRFPDAESALRELPGIGRYTAGAILSIAFDRPQPILDGNVARVLSRYHAEKDNGALWARAESAVRSAARAGLAPSDFNQALMELGALVCLPRLPSCGVCPIRSGCKARIRNLHHLYPVPAQRAQTLRLREARLAVFNARSQVLLVRNPPDARWFQGLWDLPRLDREEARKDAEVAERFAGLLPIRFRGWRKAGEATHSITRHRILCAVYAARSAFQDAPSLPDNWRWVDLPRVKKFSHSSLLRKALALAAGKLIE